MGPSQAGAARRFRVLIDGRPPGDDHGVDTDVDGHGIVGEPRLHQLVRQRGTVADRQLDVKFIDRGIDLFSFTFG